MLSGNSASRRRVCTVSIFLHIFRWLQLHLTSQAKRQSWLNLG